MEWKTRADGKRTIVSIVPNGSISALHIQTNASGLPFDLLAIGEKRVMHTLASGRLPATKHGWIVVGFETPVEAAALELIITGTPAIQHVATSHAVQVAPISPNWVWVGASVFVAAGALGSLDL